MLIGWAKWWKIASEHAGGPDIVGPPHSARHTSASRDLALGRRSFEEVKRRGRWKSDDAVPRYAQTHKWFECEQRLREADPATFSRGEEARRAEPDKIF